MKIKGFTLIETITYLGLLSVILAVLSPTFYFITTETYQNQIYILENEELNFITKKINYLISSAFYVEQPLGGETSNVLKIISGNTAPQGVEIGIENQSIYLKRGNSGREMLSSSRIKIANVYFIHHEATDTIPESISYSFSLGSQYIPTTTIQIAKHE